MQSFEQALAFVNAITGNQAETAIIDWRAIHDVDKSIPAIPFRDTLGNAWNSIVYYNNAGYGIFAVVAALDGNGRELANVAAIRAHYVDLDNLSAQQNLERAAVWYPAPSFAVQSSAGKFHVYWPVVPYAGNDRFQLIQRKLIQLFDSDKRIVDATRVMRLPGTYHLKNPQQPHLVTCFSLPGYGSVNDASILEIALAGVNVIDHSGSRHELGEPSLAAPSLYWLQFAVGMLDPNTLDRGDWISVTAAFKQAGWTLGDEQTIFNIWSEWCARYANNDVGENLKQWNSIRNTEVGWKYITRKVPGLVAYLNLDGKPKSVPAPSGETPPPMPVPQPPAQDCSGELLNHLEQQVWFKDCILVTSKGEILTSSVRFMNASKFNAEFGGKKFIVDQQGKVTNEPWQAATRSTLWTVPKVDHTRFLPSRAYGETVTDDLGRIGVNLYRPAIVERREGDVSPFLNHLAMLLPVENDRRIILEYLAHNAKFPGFKIPWSPVLQSAEGVGKGVLKYAMERVMGESYVYFPNAKEMVDSGSKFNAWMRNRLFILADEIRTDERRDMIEVLKPMISEERIEIQGKGENQEKEDNFANWMFFTNYKDAVPVNKNSRRFAIFYSAIQSIDDLVARVGNIDDYFNRLMGWLKEGGGSAIVSNYLLSYPIERGAIPMRAPDTSSTAEALRQSRGPIDSVILDAIADALPGFRGGWVSSIAVNARLKATGHRAVSARALTAICEGLGMYEIGRSPRSFFAEDATSRATLYNTNRAANVQDYGRWQGYE